MKSDLFIPVTDTLIPEFVGIISDFLAASKRPSNCSKCPSVNNRICFLQIRSISKCNEVLLLVLASKIMVITVGVYFLFFQGSGSLTFRVGN